MVGTSETFVADTYTPQYFDTSATAGTQVSYRVRAISGGDDLSGDFAEQIGWRSLGSSALTATDGTSTASVTLTWTPVTGATEYEIQRGTSATSYAALTTVSQLTYVDTTATAGTGYLYRVRAKSVFNATQAAYGDYSAPDAGKRALDMTPITVAASNRTSASSITLTLTVPTGTPAAYTVLRALGNGKAKAIGTIPAGTLTYVDSSSLKAGKTYTYTVRLATATSGGTKGQGVKAPVGPAGVTATEGTLTTGTTITWTSAPKATAYIIYRAAPGGTAAPIGQVGKKVYSYTDTGAYPGVKYTYSVRANSSVGLSVEGSDVGWRALAAPTSLTASTNLPTKIQLNWASSTGASGYVVRRTGATSGTVEFIVGGNSYGDTSAEAGVSYTYTVKATLGDLVSAYSAAATGSRTSGYTGSIMAAGAGNAHAGKGGHGRTGAQESAEGAAGDEAIVPPHHWLVDGTVVESGLVFIGDEDVVEVKLRDPSSTDDMSILFVTGELSLGGRLVLDFGDRVPVAGDRWVILLAGRMSGEFRSVRGIDLPDGLRLDARMDGPTFSVTVVADDSQQ
jgi:fibronectin type 3 domain-containing protein